MTNQPKEKNFSKGQQIDFQESDNNQESIIFVLTAVKSLGENEDDLERSVRLSKEEYLKKVEMLKGMTSTEAFDETVDDEENLFSLSSKVQDFLQERRIFKKVLKIHSTQS